MTISENQRRANLDTALQRMSEMLGAQSIDQCFFQPADQRFSDLPPTTWTDLVQLGWIAPVNLSRGTQYQLTGTGWLEAIRRSAAIEDPAFGKRLEQLSAALKSYVKERESEAIVGLACLAQMAQLDEDWVFNAIDSHLLQNVYGRSDASWLARGRLVVIPLDFGMTSVDVAKNLEQKVEELKIQLAEVEEQLGRFQCPHCNAPVVEQHSVHLTEDDDGYYEAFACGYAMLDGTPEEWCPSDPRFPKLEEYELVVEAVPQSGEPFWRCYAEPKSEHAKCVRVMPTLGRTPEEARQGMVDAYKQQAEPWKP